MNYLIFKILLIIPAMNDLIFKILLIAIDWNF